MATMSLVVEAIGTCLLGSLPARNMPVWASMSTHEPASSFGAPGGASWAAALWREGATTSRIESAIRVATLLTRTILARTRSSPLPSTAGRRPPGPFSPYNEAAGGDRSILHERTVAYHLPCRAISTSALQLVSFLKC